MDEKGLKESWEEKSWLCYNRYGEEGKCHETNKECSIENCPRSLEEFMSNDLKLNTTRGSDLVVEMNLEKYSDEYRIGIRDMRSTIRHENYSSTNKPVVISKTFEDRDTALELFEFLSDFIEIIREKDGRLYLDYMEQNKMKFCPECHAVEDEGNCEVCGGLGLVDYSTYSELMRGNLEEAKED